MDTDARTLGRKVPFSNMTRPIPGSCLCGAVRFAVTPPTRFVAHCHCLNCQRAHGAGVVTWAGVPEAQFAVVSGAERLRAHLTKTGATRGFCAECGSPLTFRSPRWTGEVHVAVACLDEPLAELPRGHVYADRAPVWCPVPDDGLPRFGGESGTERLG